MMLDKTTDTTVRAVLYEAAGTVAPAVLEAGAAELALAQTLNEIPGAVLEADPRDVDAWVAGARDAIEHLLSVDRGSARTRAADSGQVVGQPVEQVADHPRRRAPDDVLADDVDVGAEGDAAAQQAPALVAGAQRAQRHLHHLGDLGGRRAPTRGRAR